MTNTRFGLLAPPLRRFAEALVEARPELDPLMDVGEHLGPCLVVRSPTGESSRRVVAWDEDGDLGLGFGPWHTHGDVARTTEQLSDEVDALLAIVLRIVDDELVICIDVDGDHAGFESVLDMSEPDAVLDALMQRWSPSALEIKTWSGRGDRSLRADEPA